MDVTTLELKFLLRLLAYPSYRTAISKIQLNSETKASERDRVCYGLCSKGLVSYSNEVKQFGITLAGRTLLELDTSTLPVTPDELWVLRTCQKGLVTPGKIPAKVPETIRQRLIQTLDQRGLVKVHSTQVLEVWLTSAGKEFLLTYVPEGASPVLSLSLLGNYLQFLRQNLVASGSTVSTGRTDEGVISEFAVASVDTAQRLLDIIVGLDREFRTDNSLPIFHLREATKSFLDNEALEQLLYQLQREDRIELSALQEVAAYSQSQVEAGIPQDMGGPLFFISVV